ncbi:MAG: hypothetical protein HY507_01270 [Candidatus Zambryskibacteria bacterium]|nr:hypothetical protein [Candidatus Zambryskibacteria bacterium]
MKWKQPPIIKIYEALGAIADGWVKVVGNTAEVYSSSGNKFYDVTYNPVKKTIMANDNGSYWKGYLGYPAIVFLMKARVVSYNKKVSDLLKDFAWKDINQKFKNNFDKTLIHILSSKSEREKKMLIDFTTKVESEIKALKLGYFGKRILPPEGY